MKARVQDYYFALQHFLVSRSMRNVSSHLFFFNNTAPPEIYPLPLPDALPISRRGADHGPRARLERFRDRHRHPAILERAGRVEPLALEVDLEARVGRLGEARRQDERCVALAERDDRRLGRHGKEVAVLLDDAAPGLHWGPPSTRIIVVAAATSASLSMPARARRMSRSRASCVSITTGTASRVPRPFWVTFAIEVSLSPRMPATFESTPGRASAITRRQ